MGLSRVGDVELVVDKKTGRVRQAGASQTEGAWIEGYRQKCERNLYLFARGILGLTRLTKRLHRPICGWLADVSRYKRKMMLLPRDHLKTSVFRAMALHMLIQPAETNLYFPGSPGCNTRILWASETATNAEHQLRWLAQQILSNPLFRALWPGHVWTNQREAPKWSGSEIVVPRTTDFPEASIETIGVGGAVVGRHYDVFLKDDLVTFQAANSEVTMRDAIEWHKTSRALMDDPSNSLEFIIGTRWAVYDLYQEIIDNDPSVEVIVRSAIEEGEPIFPEMFPIRVLEELRRSLGVMFYLLYMNSPANPELADFDTEQIRGFEVDGFELKFGEDMRDVQLEESVAPSGPPPDGYGRGERITAANYSRLLGPFATRRKQLEEENWLWQR